MPVRPTRTRGGGGYFHGKQPDIEPASGRGIFAPIPPGWAGLGTQRGLCFDGFQRGELMALQVAGNVMELQNTGVMWAEEFTAFILEFRFTQSIVDRRLFYLPNKAGLLLMVGTSVGVCKLVVQSGAMAAAFNKAWEKRYRDPPDVDATAHDFGGLK